MSYNITPTDNFNREAKKIAKKHRSLKSIIYIFFILLFIDAYLLVFKDITILVIDSFNLLKYIGTAQFFVTLFGVSVAAKFLQLLIVFIKTHFSILGLEKHDLAYSTDDNLKAVSLLISIMICYTIYASETTQTLLNYWLPFKFLYTMLFVSAPRSTSCSLAS